MKKDEVVKRVWEQLGEFRQKPLEVFVDGATLGNDLGADSLDQIELVMAFEEELRIELADADVDLFFGPNSQLGALAAFIEGRTEAA